MKHAARCEPTRPPLQAERHQCTGGVVRTGVGAGRSRGLIIPTALFLVLILFALVTAIQLTVTQNFQVTRHGHARTQARSMAKGQAQRLLERLNVDAAAESLYMGEAKRSREESEMGMLEAWVEPGPQADLLFVVGQARHRSGVTERHVLSILKKPPNDPVFFARPTVGSEHAGTLMWAPGIPRAEAPTKITPTAWEPLPPVPNWISDGRGTMVDISASGQMLFPFANKLRAPTADFMGNVYAVRRRAAGYDDRIVRFNLDRWQWTVLPEVPNIWYKKNGEKHSPDSRVKIAELATDGGNRLFACRANGPLETVYTLDQSASRPAWEVLPPAPEKLWTLKGEEKPDTGDFADNMHDLAADSKGNLYARQQRGYVDTIYRFETSTRTWSAIPPPPKKCWKLDRDTDKLALVPMPEAVAQNLTSLSVGESNELYAVFTRDGVDTIYRYDHPRGGSTAEPWQTINHPVPRRFVADADQGDLEGDPDLGATRLRRTGVDSHGKFYVRWNRSGVDSVFVFDPSNNSFGLLAAVPKKQWRKQGDTPAGSITPTPRLDNDSSLPGNQGVFHNLPDIFAGGRPKPGAGPRYIQVASF